MCTFCWTSATPFLIVWLRSSRIMKMFVASSEARLFFSRLAPKAREKSKPEMWKVGIFHRWKLRKISSESFADLDALFTPFWSEIGIGPGQLISSLIYAKSIWHLICLVRRCLSMKCAECVFVRSRTGRSDFYRARPLGKKLSPWDHLLHFISSVHLNHINNLQCNSSSAP